jgi:hypothetical protein
MSSAHRIPEFTATGSAHVGDLSARSPAGADESVRELELVIGPQRPKRPLMALSMGHGDGCACAAHRPASVSATDGGVWSALLPVLVCAVCPACLTTYAKVFSVLGVGFGLTEAQHLILLMVAIVGSIAVSAWRSWRSRRVWPVAIALTGSTLVVAGHVAEVHAVEWAGVLALLIGGLSEQFRLRQRTRQENQLSLQA